MEQTGIDISTQEGTFHVHFLLGLVLGDNLGVKSILGFSKSFACDKFCRICFRSKSDMQLDAVEHSSYLRNLEQYTQDLELDNIKLTNVRENSILNEIRTFHVTENFSVNITHDLFEGVCHYDLCQILLRLIENNIISLDTLNYRKNMFTYGEIEIGNNSSCEIQMQRLKSCNLKMSASEMWNFIHFIPLIIGDLIPIDNPEWKLLRVLVRIIDIVLLPKFSDSDIELLRSSVKAHHEIYVQLFGPLKPKHHFMVHYATSIFNCGPLKYVWSFRFESKHIKKYASVISSRRNIAYSVSIKCCYKFTNFIQNFNSSEFPNNLQVTNMNILDRNNLYQCLEKINEINYLAADVVEKAKYNGLMYKRNYYLTTNIEKLHLYKILDLIISTDKRLYIISEEINIGNFNEHYISYEVNTSTKSSSIKNVDFFNSSPLHIYNMNFGTFLRNKCL